MIRRAKQFTSGAEAQSSGGPVGTTEVVPFPKATCETVSQNSNSLGYMIVQADSCG